MGWRDLYTIYERFNLQGSGYEQSVDIVNQFYQYLDAVFASEKPDAVIGECPAGLFGLIAWHFCKDRNIPFVEVVESRVPDRMDVWDLEYTYTGYEKTFNVLKKEDVTQEELAFADNFIKRFITHEIMYASMGVIKIRFSVASFIRHYVDRLKEAGGVWLAYLKERNRIKAVDYESEFIFWRGIASPFRVIKRSLKIFFEKTAFQKISPHDKYFLFPMQYEPEASTLVLATYYSNQLATIKNVAMALPLPYKLYLKEHPGSIGLRRSAFYDEIKKIPNAVLVSSAESTPNLIKNSAGVITMTSTAGMESAMAGKPTYVLGNVFYSYHPFCRRVINFTDLENKMKEDIQNPPNKEGLEDMNIRFLTAYLRNNTQANMLTLEKNDYPAVAKFFKEMAGKLKNA